VTIKTIKYDYDKYGKFCRLCEEPMTITGHYKLYGAQSGEHVATEFDYHCEACGEESYSVEYEVV